MSIVKEAQRARKVARIGEVGNKRGGKVGVKDLARFNKKGVNLVSKGRRGEGYGPLQSLMMEILCYEFFDGCE